MNKMLYAILKDSTFITKMDALIAAVKPNAADIPLNTPQGMNADDVQEGIEELNSNLTNFVKKKYITGTTSANGNFDITYTIAQGTWLVIGASIRDKDNTSTIYVATPYQYSSGGYGYICGLHLVSEAINGSAANKNIEGYVFYVPYPSNS